MKKAIAILTAIFMLFALTACEEDKTDNTTEDAAANAVVVSVSNTAEENDHMPGTPPEGGKPGDGGTPPEKPADGETPPERPKDKQ